VKAFRRDFLPIGAGRGVSEAGAAATVGVDAAVPALRADARRATRVDGGVGVVAGVVAGIAGVDDAVPAGRERAGARQASVFTAFASSHVSMRVQEAVPAARAAMQVLRQASVAERPPVSEAFVSARTAATAVNVRARATAGASATARTRIEASARCVGGCAPPRGGATSALTADSPDGGERSIPLPDRRRRLPLSRLATQRQLSEKIAEWPPEIACLREPWSGRWREHPPHWQ
jgi:hypothetical protein